uniref:Uncharacterized protein n=1 Tax=Rhizophora mucronata TaxID=61149 RepID=A0A2P2N750_RHIMU
MIIKNLLTGKGLKMSECATLGVVHKCFTELIYVPALH